MLLDLLDRVLRILVPAPTTRPDRVIVYGRYRKWLLDAAGVGAPVWDGIAAVRQVELAETMPDLLRIAARQRWSAIAIPFRERQLLFCPRLFWGLMPSRRALGICRDKLRFDSFVRRAGLAELVPRRFRSAETAEFPCFIKRVNKAGGEGIAVVHTAAELAEFRRRTPWRNRRILLQELVPGELDYATNCVCRDGRIVWHCTYEYRLDPAIGIQRPGSIVARRRLIASAGDLALLERFVAAIGYDGPAQFDYRPRADGRLVVLEINPRFGGSIMRPENIGDLRAGLEAVIANAMPPG